MASSSLAAVYRAHAAPVLTTPAAVAGAAVVISAGTTSPTVAVEVGGLVRQIIGVLRGGQPEDALGRGRVGAPERVPEGVHDDGEVLGEV